MRIRTGAVLSAALVVLGCIDRLIKTLVLHGIPAEGWFVWNQTLGIRLEYNTGIAYGIPIGQPWLVITITSVIVVVLSAYAARLQWRQQPMHLLSIGSIIVGTLSNMIDRIQYGSVIDYLYIVYMPRFNLADLLIAGGIVLWLSLLWRKRLDEPARVS